MKNFKYIAFSFLLTGSAVLTGCLDEEPLYSQNNLVIFSSESNARQALLGCYGYMAAPNGYGPAMAGVAYQRFWLCLDKP